MFEDLQISNKVRMKRTNKVVLQIFTDSCQMSNCYVGISNLLDLVLSPQKNSNVEVSFCKHRVKIESGIQQDLHD